MICINTHPLMCKIDRQNYDEMTLLPPPSLPPSIQLGSLPLVHHSIPFEKESLPRRTHCHGLPGGTQCDMLASQMDPLIMQPVDT